MSTTEKPETPGQFASVLAHNLHESLVSSVDPVRKVLAEVEQTITEREAELVELRRVRTEAKKLVAILDPSLPVTGRKTGRTTARVSVEKVEALHAFLVQNYANGDGFSVPVLVEHSDWSKAMSEPTLNNALLQLQDDGRIRLDHLGHRGRKVYKLVTS